MIGYSLLGSNDYPKAQEFYDKLMAGLGAKRVLETDRITMYGNGEGGLFGICEPADGNAASSGNGTMIALPVGSNEAVDNMRDLALSIHAPDVSDINNNPEINFYGVYVRDYDHNKICFYNM